MQLSEPRVLRFMVLSVAGLILFGWWLGDDWLWTIVRAFALPATSLGIVASYGWHRIGASAGRIALGAFCGGLCARNLGGDVGAALLAALGFGLALTVCEYAIARDRR